MRHASFAAAVVAAIMLFSPAPAAAQHQRGPDTAAQRAAIERLAPLAGRWQGEAQVFSPVQRIVHQTEEVEPGLNGLVLIINGTGHASADRTGDPVFRAFAVISYDTRSNQYEVRAYTHEGYATTATGAFLDDGSFRWSFAPGGPVQVRFTIAVDETTWRELGEISMDNGATWARTVDLSLRRVN
jgi:hypothetical protein